MKKAGNHRIGREELHLPDDLCADRDAQRAPHAADEKGRGVDVQDQLTRIEARHGGRREDQRGGLPGRPGPVLLRRSPARASALPAPATVDRHRHRQGDRNRRQRVGPGHVSRAKIRAHENRERSGVDEAECEQHGVGRGAPAPIDGKSGHVTMMSVSVQATISAAFQAESAASVAAAATGRPSRKRASPR